MLKPFIAIPLYNNHKTIRQVVEKALKQNIPVLVVNDGSTDGGLELVKELDISWISYSINQGKGAAILAAAEWGETYDYTHMITLDADGQHDPDDVPKFLEMMEENPASIIVGKRMFSKEEVPFSSRFGRKWSNLWIRITTGQSLADSQSGFRVYPVSALRKIPCAGIKYDFEVEILVRGAWAGLELYSVDISVHYSEETKKGSHFNPVKDNYRISVAYTRLVIRQFMPVPHKVIFEKKIEDDTKKLSLFHPIKSLNLLLRENTTPSEIVYASMLGVFLGTLPLIAAHSVSIVFVATRLRLNRIVALTVSNVCMPPLIPAIAVEVGYYILHGRFLTEFTMQTLGYEAPQRLAEYILGAILLAPIFTGMMGVFAYYMILAYQNFRCHYKEEKGVE